MLSKLTAATIIRMDEEHKSSSRDVKSSCTIAVSEKGVVSSAVNEQKAGCPKPQTYQNSGKQLLRSLEQLGSDQEAAFALKVAVEWRHGRG